MQLSRVKYQPECTRTFLGSPSLVRLDSGILLASHDYFGPGCPRNHEGEESLTSLYRSEDDGESWQHLTHIMNCYWSTLFRHAGCTWLLGVSQQYGSIVMRKSTDGGCTWSHPADSHSGLLFPGGPLRQAPYYHCAPTPILVHQGRLYKGFEDCTPDNWGSGFQSLVISAPADADLLEAANWRMSNKLAFDRVWLPAEWSVVSNPGWLEGNVVAAPDGTLRNILRFNSAPLVDCAVSLHVEEDGAHLRLDPSDALLSFPGGMTKFTIRRDPLTGRYLALVKPNTVPACPSQRNILALSESADLVHWRVRRVILEDESGLEQADSVHLTGFQYVDWQFDGADLIYLVRAAYRGASNYHDANRILFGRLRNYQNDLNNLGEL